MKKSLLLVLSMILASVGIAQQQLAILNHNDTISAFYGRNALSQAHNAAVKGDVITLSAGLFNAITVTKQVTIRGAGMSPVDSLNIQNTVISGNMTLNVPFDSNYVLTIEGMKFISYVKYSQAYYPVFKKCRFTSFSRSDNGTMSGAQFVQCVLGSYGGDGLTGTRFINSVIYNELSAPSQLDHCVASIHHTLSTLTSMIVYNSVVYYIYDYGNGNGESYNSSSSYYSIGINRNNGSRYFDVTNVVGHHLWNKTAYNQVFKYYNGSYSEGMSFELLDDVAASYLGDDSTQVGIYGGLYPFDPVVHPVIGTLNVARRTNNEQKLEVTIDLINEE